MLLFWTIVFTGYNLFLGICFQTSIVMLLHGFSYGFVLSQYPSKLWRVINIANITFYQFKVVWFLKKKKQCKLWMNDFIVHKYGLQSCTCTASMNFFYPLWLKKRLDTQNVIICITDNTKTSSLRSGTKVGAATGCSLHAFYCIL